MRPQVQVSLPVLLVSQAVVAMLHRRAEASACRDGGHCAGFVALLSPAVESELYVIFGERDGDVRTLRTQCAFAKRAGE
ncbi:hypothetical protein PR003_g12438 [Phytophthora rubi]|uniref:Secreted protein n=1 Tax=Phytophthora rubi TaxID=129364 RepID=A0A6A4F533_9STRA|nr:hypothetical protein PR001_g11802 [Phytophthora rubi]KAE9336583.1 hypothetical protein PR003_g12438 [Phytophthora rubi]